MNCWFCANGLCLYLFKSQATLLGAHQHLRLFLSVPSVSSASFVVGVSSNHNSWCYYQ